MNDCPNAEIRDTLPDLAHERLDAGARARVMSHVDGCADCSAELALLRELHGLLVASTPRVNVAHVVAALPSAAALRGSRISARSASRSAGRSSWTTWRAAAAIAVMVVGSASVGTYLSIGNGSAPQGTERGAQKNASVAPLIPGATPLVVGQTAVPKSANAGSNTGSAGGSTVTELQAGDGLSDMSEAQLKSLLNDIQHLEPLPPTEPDSVVVAAPDVNGEELD